MATTGRPGPDVPGPRAKLEIVLLPVDRPGLAELTRAWCRELGTLAGSAAASGLKAGRSRLRRSASHHRPRTDGVGRSAAVPTVSPPPDRRPKVMP
jgi:hypothetical protein